MKKETILIVDDVEINRELLSTVFEKDYNILEASDGDEAIAILEKHEDCISVVLLDIVMPRVDGYEVLRVMEEKKWLKKIPVLLVTGDTSLEAEEKGWKTGVSDIIRKPYNPRIIKQRVENIIELYVYKRNLEKQVSEQTEILKKQFVILKKQSEKLKETNRRIIETMSTVVEFRSLESGKHIRRIQGFTEILAREIAKHYPEYELTEEKIEMISSASALHDVGKISISDNILLKPGKLTADEFEVMKSHTTRGCEIINMISDIQDRDYYEMGYAICRYHHERYDGKGYPDGLSGEQIPIAAQIVSVADVYDALVSERVYKAAFSKDKAFDMIIKGECGVFSPRLIECLKIARKKMEQLADELEETGE